jgi:heme exporter protein D
MLATGQAGTMRRYLLGALPEAEQATIEERFFADAEVLEEIRAVEHQLVDDYVRGRLGRAERAQFEQYYLDSAPHRERVAVARMLLRAADAEAVSANEPEPQISAWAKFLAMLRGPQLVWGLAAAALLLVVAGGTKLLIERAQLRAQLAATQAQQQQRERELAAQIAATRKQNEHLATELERLRQAEQPITKEPKRATIFSFLLTPSLLRGNSAPQPLTIPRDAEHVALRVRLEADDYATYQASLRTVEGVAIWSRRNLKARADRLAVVVPATKLAAGDYILTLSGVKADTTEEVNRYFFRVSKK